jgi:hypothetical protein
MNLRPVPLRSGKEELVGEFKSERKRLPRIFADRSEFNPELHKKAEEEASRRLTRDANLNGEKFDDVVKRSDTVLFKAKTIFPFDFFPNDLIIDITKVTVITRNFFFSGQTQSINIKDILDIVVETGPFFATIRVIDMGYLPTNKIHIKYLKKKDAMQARAIIEGLLAANKAGVDITKIPRRELISRLPDLARAQTMPSP